MTKSHTTLEKIKEIYNGSPAISKEMFSDNSFSNQGREGGDFFLSFCPNVPVFIQN